MSPTPSDPVAIDSEELCRAADAAASVLAVGSRLAGPAAPQEDIGQLIVADDVRGAWSELPDGTVVVVFAATSSLSPAAQGPTGDGVVVELGPAVDAAAAVLGQVAASPRSIVDLADLPISLTAERLDRQLVGAGVFEGELPVASVGVCAFAGAPGAAAGASTTASANSVATGVDAPSSSEPTAGDAAGGPRNFHLLADVELGISAELGRTTMSMGELLDLQPGGVIELKRTVGTPIDVLVNGTLIARGEVVVVEDAYAVRVTEVVSEKAEG
jgi:flagellar motor switch protein FliN/FliY